MNSKINAILTLAAILLALAGAKAQTQVEGAGNSNYHVFDGSGNELLNTNFKGHIYRITRRGDVMTELCVDSKKIPPAEYSKYDSVVNRIVLQVRIDEAQAKIDLAQAERDRRHSEIDLGQAAGDQQQAKGDREQAAADQQQAAEDRREVVEDRENLRGLIALLVGKKLIPDTTALKTLLLTDDELVVNGKKASPGKHQEIKERYSRWAHLGLSVGDGCDCNVTVHFHTAANR